MTLPDILFEDEFLIALDKPAGMPVVAERRGARGVALMDLVHRERGAHVASVHRLDGEASGIVLCAKTKPALDFLSGQFQSKTVSRSYGALAVVLPAEAVAGAMTPARGAGGALPAAFTVDLDLGPEEGRPERMRVFRRRGGKAALTEFKVMEAFGRFAWLECRPLTGRTHQARVHLAACGAPVLNDALYGDPGSVLLLSDLKRRYKGREAERPLVSRLALHAGALGFVHPASREPMVLAAPLPKDLEVALKYLRRFPIAGSPARPPR